MVIDQRAAAPVDTGAGPRHAAVPVRELALHALLVVAATVAAATGAPILLTAPLALLAVVTVVERVVRFRRRGLLDAVLCGVAGVIIALALLGLLLNFLPWGLTRQSWSVGAGVLSLVGLACCLRRDDPPSMVGVIAGHSRSAGRPRLAPYAVVGALLVIGSLVLASRSSTGIHLTPVEMSSSSTAAGSTAISLQSDTAAGPFDLVIQSDAGGVVAASGVTIAPGAPIVIGIGPLPSGRVVVQLTPTGGGDAIRELIFNGSPAAGEN